MFWVTGANLIILPTTYRQFNYTCICCSLSSDRGTVLRMHIHVGGNQAQHVRTQLDKCGGNAERCLLRSLDSWFHLVSRITEQDERLTVLFKCINAKVSTSFFLSVCVGKPFDSSAVDRRSGPVLLACSWKVVWVSRCEPESVSVLTFWHFQLLSPINSGWHSWRC